MAQGQGRTGEREGRRRAGARRQRERRSRRAGAAATALLLLPVLGCDGGITLPDDVAFQTGVLAGVNGVDFSLVLGWEPPEVVETLWVKEGEEDVCGVIWTVGDGTDLLVREGSALRRAVPEDLVPFRDVRVWTSGPIAESCPAQGTADAVEFF